MLLALFSSGAWAQTRYSGSGSSSDPYLIQSVSDWNTFADAVTNGTSYSGKYFRLTTDITVTNTVGKYPADFYNGIYNNSTNYCFQGTFDGNGKTITLDNVEYTNEYGGLFKMINRGATIKNLKVNGSVSSSYNNVGGIVGGINGYSGRCYIQNCWSDVTITSNSTGSRHCGIVAFINDKATIQGCVFTGKLLGSGSVGGGLFGHQQNAASTFQDCIFAPSEITLNSADSHILYSGSNGSTSTNCYYYWDPTTFGHLEGTRAYKVTLAANPAAGGTVDGGTPTTDYGFVKAYSNGLLCNGIYYANGSVSLNATANDGYEFDFWIKNGTETIYDTPYGFTVDADADFQAHFSEPLPTVSCTPSFSSTTDYIASFSLGSISNTNSGFSSGGYGNFTSMSTDLEQGVTANATLTSSGGSGDHYVGIWIDFDNNGTFADSEKVSNYTSSIGPSTTVQIPLTIPANAALGNHYMRVVYRYNVTPTPCMSSSYGEGEDYVVNITAATTHTLTWSNPTGGTISVTNNGTPVASGSSFTTGTQLTITAEPSSGYMFTGWTATGGATIADASSTSTTLTIGSSNCTLSASLTQGYLISESGDIFTCSGTIYDPSGPNGSYGTYNDYTRTIYPGTSGNAVMLTFTEFNTESNYDFLYVYDGTSSDASLIGKYSGNTLPATITAGNSEGALTLRWTSDGSTNGTGWAASISCVAPVTLTLATNPSGAGTITATQNGTTLSSGASVFPRSLVQITAEGNSGYLFNGWTVSGTDAAVADANSATSTFTMGSGNTTLTASFTQGYLISDAGAITTCSGTIYDSGGPNGNYSDSENYTKTIYPGTPGKAVQLEFTSFITEYYNYDYLNIYDGIDDTAPQLGHYCSSTSGSDIAPFTVTASNSSGALTLKWHSDSGTNYGGFAANISCEDVEYTPAVTVGNITANSATANWTGNSSSYTVRYGMGFPTEGFESSSLPDGWSHIGNGTGTPESSDPYTGSKSLKFSGARSDNVVVLPQVVGSETQISFWSKAEGSSSGEFDLGYVTDATDVNTFVALATYTYSQHGTYTHVENYSLSSVPAGARVAFRHRSGATNWFWFIDDVVVSGSVSTATTSNTTYDITNLEPNCTYWVTVQGTNSLESAPVIFQTLNTTHTVTIVSNNADYGSVSQNTVLNVPHGATITTSGNTLTVGSTTVTATPQASTAQYTYAFSDWSNVPATVTENVIITANFTQTANSYTVTIEPNDANYGSVSPGSVTSVPYGTTITTSDNTLMVGSTTVTATPAQATGQYTYAFSDWSNVPATVTENVTITANFTQTANSYALTLIADPTAGGTVSASPAQATYHYGDVVEVTATPNSGYTFGSWSDNGAQTHTVTITEDTELTAYFGADQTLTTYANPIEGGYVTIAENQVSTLGAVTVGNGSTGNVTGPYMTATQYSFQESVYTAAELGNTARTITSISYNITVLGNSASDHIEVYMKNVSRSTFANNSDYEPVTANDKVYDGYLGRPASISGSAWITIILDKPFQYNGTDNLMIGIHENTPGNSGRNYMYTTTSGNTTIACFDYNADMDPTASNTFNYLGKNRANVRLGFGTYHYGQSVTLTAHANDGYQFVNWTENNTEVEATDTYTVTIDGDHTIYANFERLAKRFVTAGNWNVAGNWTPEGVPTATDDVFIEAAATIPNGCVATANEITVTTTGSITIADGGQLQHNNTGVRLTAQKEITGYTENNAQTNKGYYLISSPVDVIAASDVTGLQTSGHYDLYKFVSNNMESGNLLEWVHVGDNGSLVRNEGYIYASRTDTRIEITGTVLPSNTTISNTLTYNEGYRFGGWNLIGNPFVCNAYVNVANYYILNHQSGYDEFFATDNTHAIAPMSGLMVVATATGQSVTYSRTAPSKGSGILNIDVNRTMDRGTTMLDRARVRFGEGEGLQKFQFNPNHTKVYIPQDGSDYAVVYADGAGTIPVNFKAQDNGRYTLDFSTEDVGFNYLHLIDNMNGNDVDLLQTPYYAFDAKSTDFASRFTLVFATGNDNDGNFAFFNNGVWIINNDGDAELQVVDVLGHILSSETISGSCSKAINVAPGVYMLRIVNGDKVKVQKIVVRR